MPIDRQQGVVSTHAMPIVRDAQLRLAAVAYFDLDPRCKRIERVFNQLLDGGRRALDYLAGRNLVGDVIG